MSGLSAPVMVLASLLARFPDLPAVDVRVSTVFPDRVELSAHDDLAVFEAWRQALDIDPEAVVHRVQNEGATQVLDVHAVLMGARVRLIGFAPTPVLVPGEGVGS